MKKFLKSLVTDKEWDGDPSKVLGWILVAFGLFGWISGRDSLELLILGTGILGVGKAVER